MTNARRDMLKVFVAMLASFGAGVAALPLFRSLVPARHLEPRNPDLHVDITKLKEGQLLTVSFRGRPIVIYKRPEHVLRALAIGNSDLRDPNSERSHQPDYASNIYRSLRPELFVGVNICTHLGCSTAFVSPGTEGVGSPIGRSGGFFCPCHGSYYDLSGRVFKDLPAPNNLAVPKYDFPDTNTLRLIDI